MQSYKVLVADDEIANLNGVVSLLTREFPEIQVVATFTNGRDVIEYLESNTVDIAILDIRMPLVDGLEVAEYIYSKGIETSVVIMTGYKEFEYAKRAIDIHVSTFLEKPFDMKHVISKIKEVCNERMKARGHRKTFDEQLNISKIVRLLIENLMMQKQNEIEMLNQIISCYTQSQLHEFIQLFLERINEILEIDQAYYLNYTESIQNTERLLKTILDIEKVFMEKLYSDAYNVHNMKKIEKYIEEHCGEDLTLKSVADKFFYNYSYLSRVFKEKEGKTFSAFLLEARMNRAKKLLEEDGASAIEIAGMVGYDGYSNFRKRFKDYTGVSPSQYAELQRMKKDEKK